MAEFIAVPLPSVVTIYGIRGNLAGLAQFYSESGVVMVPLEIVRDRAGTPSIHGDLEPLAEAVAKWRDRDALQHRHRPPPGFDRAFHFGYEDGTGE